MQYVASILLAAGFFVSGGWACFTNITDISSPVTIVSPSYMDNDVTLRNMSCEWIIGPSAPNTVIGLDVVSSILPKWSNWTGCPVASLIISDGPYGDSYDSPLMVTACGTDIPPIITSNGRYMQLRLITSPDHLFKGLGFVVRVFEIFGPTTATTTAGSNIKNSSEGISPTLIIIIACSVFAFIVLLIVALVCCHKAWTNKLREGVSRLSANPENKVAPVTSHQSFPVLPTQPVLVEEALSSDPQPPEPGTASVEPVTETADRASIPADTVTKTTDPVTETTDPNIEAADTNTETADPVTETADHVKETADPNIEAADTNTETADPVTKTADPVNEAAGTNVQTDGAV